MIVRIATEGQYRLQSLHLDRLNELDHQLMEAVAGGSAETFGRLFAQMLGFIRSNGQPVADEEIEESDIFLPPPDTTLDEARALFRGEGAIPGRGQRPEPQEQGSR